MSVTRRLAKAYHATADWSILPPHGRPDELEGAALATLLKPNAAAVRMRFTTVSEYDALNRVVSASTPDGGVTVYNEANLLEAV